MFILTHHAVKRYRERIETGLRYSEAKVRLMVALSQAEELKPPLLWQYVARRDFLETCDYLYHPTLKAVFALTIDGQYRVVATVLEMQRVQRRPAHGSKRAGGKYRGRMGLRIDGGYKRRKYRPGESEE